MFGLFNTKTLPILTGKEFFTFKGQGCEKRLIEKCVPYASGDYSRLKLFQIGELLNEPWLQWTGATSEIQSAAQEVDRVIEEYEHLERTEQLETIYNSGTIRIPGYRSFSTTDVRCYMLRYMPYNDTAEFTIYFHGDGDPEKTKIRFDDDFKKISRQFAEFLTALHQCSFNDALRCAQSIAEEY